MSRPFETKKALVSLVKHFHIIQGTVNAACYTIAKKLKNKWTGKYIYHVYSGKSNPSPKLRRAIIRLYKKTFTKCPRHRLYIQAESAEQKANWMKLTMEQRREALDKAYIEN